jgi:Family of unknown function (DUF6176)
VIRVGFARIRPDKESRLHDWLVDLSRRRSEVIESFKRETVRHEQVFILPGGDAGPLLVYVVEAEDHARAAVAYKESTLCIDEEHRAVLEECLLERLKVEPLFDCSIKFGTRTDAA